MSDFNALKKYTDQFFSKHWLGEDFCKPPKWEIWCEFLYGSVPNYDLGGCYALFSDKELIYVGSGTSKGGGRYLNHGISRRLMAHVIASDRNRGQQWSKLRERWSDVTSIYTLGFPNEVTYLAVALETFLVRELNPPRNTNV